MSDLQAKYNALLRKFIGDSTMTIDQDIETAIQNDMANMMHEKYKRMEEKFKADRDRAVAAIKRSGITKDDPIFTQNGGRKGTTVAEIIGDFDRAYAICQAEECKKLMGSPAEIHMEI